MGQAGWPRRLPLVAVAIAVAAVWAATPGPAQAQDVGQVKVSRGTAYLARGGQRLPAEVGVRVRVADVVVTGPDGAVGITFADHSLLSVGADSALVIDRFTFDPTTHQGAFESTLRRGTLTAVSGKLAKQSPEAMKVRTPVAVLGVRGTEFAVRTGEPGR